MLTSPMARGLFHRAILQSAGIPTGRAGALPLRDLATAESIAVDYARTSGIEGDGEAALVALRALPAETLRKHIDRESMISAIFGGRVIPGFRYRSSTGRLIVEATKVTLRTGTRWSR
jgi:para-nitrobenzyl esterase